MKKKFNFKKDGFEIIKIPGIKKIKNLKKKIISTFSLASELNNLKKIKSDKGIVELYSKNKLAWLAAYDQVRMLPELYHIIDDKLIKLLCKKSNINFPAFTSKPVVRICMPNEEGTSRTNLHIDYPTHRGSSNSITVWLPLHSTDKINGTLILSPKSHKKKYYNGSVSKRTVKRIDDINANYLVSPSINMGEAILLSQFTLHGSGKNISNKIRYSIDFRFNDLNNKNYAKSYYYINEKSFYKKL